MDTKKSVPTSDFLHNVIRSKRTNRITIDELKISLHERGFGILLIFFALPVSIPAPYIPGTTTVFAIPLIFLSFQMMLGFDSPWLPKWILKKSIKRSHLGFFVIKSSPILRKIEKLLKPRILFMSSHQGAKAIGLISLISAISIALPLPFTNFVPAIGVLVMSLGLLSRDGLIILIGILISLLGLAFSASVFIFGAKLVTAFMNSFF
jgi:hypothetical protein